MGGGKNLKLGEREEGKSQGTGGNNFFVCGSNVDLIQLFVCTEKM